MNTGSERRPFKVLRRPEHSTAMVIVRHASREEAVLTRVPEEPNDDQPADLLWKALRVASLCAACAFAFFVLSQRHLFERSGETVGPLTESIQRVRLDTPRAANAVDGKTVSEAVVPESLAPLADNGFKVTQFALEVSPQFQDLDGVQLRLTGVNPAAHTFDITVRTREREFYRQDVKLEEHVPLLKNSPHGPELVVAEIGRGRVLGYLSEPLHKQQHRRHRRRT